MMTWSSILQLMLETGTACSGGVGASPVPVLSGLSEVSVLEQVSSDCRTQESFFSLLATGHTAVWPSLSYLWAMNKIMGSVCYQRDQHSCFHHSGVMEKNISNSIIQYFYTKPTMWIMKEVSLHLAAFLPVLASVDLTLGVVLDLLHFDTDKSNQILHNNIFVHQSKTKWQKMWVYTHNSLDCF